MGEGRGEGQAISNYQENVSNVLKQHDDAAGRQRAAKVQRERRLQAPSEGERAGERAAACTVGLIPIKGAFEGQQGGVSVRVIDSIALPSYRYVCYVFVVVVVVVFVTRPKSH